jgi:pilus assembly protein CpaF
MTVLDRLQRRQESEYEAADGTGQLGSAALMELADHHRARLLKEQDLEKLTALPPEILRAKIEALVGAMIREEGRLISYSDRAQLITFIANEAAGYGPLEPLLRDKSITEIMVNGPDRVYIERHGRISPRSDIRFNDQDHIRHIIDRIISPLGRRIDESSPMVDARLPDGSRVNAIIPPLSISGPVLTIRRFPEVPMTMEDLTASGTIGREMSDFLRACVIAKLNILISGGTGSGKTTTLNVLAGFIPPDERVITVEDTAELQFYRSHPHVLRQESRPPNVEGQGEVTIRQLVRNALRMRPHRIIVGEVRGAEALDMLQAMNTGHEGSLTTIHANSPQDAFSRLETMVMWAGTELPSSAIREQLVSAIDIVIHQERLPDGSRKIMRIAEIQGVKRGQIILRDIFLYEHVGLDQESGAAIGSFTPTGMRPKSMPRLNRYGVPVPDEVFEPEHLVAEMGTELLRSQDITEILVNGPHEVYVEKDGRLMSRPDIASHIRDEYHLRSLINAIVAPLGRRIDEDSPMVDGWLPDGTRVHAVLPPVSQGGPVLSIRRFRDVPFSEEELLAMGCFDERMIAFLQACVKARLNILISGGTSSGKTTMLNVLSRFIPEEGRIVTIEEVPELRLERPHVVRMVAKPPDEHGEGEVTIRELVRNALRMRPDRIVVGEVRGAEALDMLQAMNTGHEGSLTTIHANSSSDAFSRLETMVIWAGGDLPSGFVMRQISVLDIVVQLERLEDGSRKMVDISEVQGIGDGGIQIQPIFIFERERTSAKGEVKGHFRATGKIPANLERIRMWEAGMPDDLFESNRAPKVVHRKA